jgi:DNA-binding MarR family transcriptional regulator
MFARAMESLGLRPPHFGVMRLLGSRPGITQQELAQLSLIDPSSMVAIVDELEELGYAERQPHPGDRRKHAIHLTADGKRMLDRAQRLANKTAQEILDPLDAGEVKELRRLLRKLARVED